MTKRILVFASRNRGKVDEVQAILKEGRALFKTLADVCGPDFDVDETGQTFSENALLKARAVHEHCGHAVLADDSGLCVDALAGKPGIYSARYAGGDRNDENNLQKLLRDLKGLKNRSAHYACAMAFIDENGRETVVEGRVDGVIIDEKRGEEGFGYDPVFYLEDRACTMAELAASEKNSISHRADALRKMRTYINCNTH